MQPEESVVAPEEIFARVNQKSNSKEPQHQHIYRTLQALTAIIREKGVLEVGAVRRERARLSRLSSAGCVRSDAKTAVCKWQVIEVFFGGFFRGYCAFSVVRVGCWRVGSVFVLAPVAAAAAAVLCQSGCCRRWR
jgi:hypothetical protein